MTLFTRQLATLLHAGMPLVRSLEVLARQERQPAFQQVIIAIAQSVRAGGTFTDGLRAHGRVFDGLYLNMARAGEAGGVLHTVLERLAGFMEKARRTAGRVKAAMIYPAIIVAVASVIVGLLMIFVVPRFQEIFAGVLRGRPLPVLTQWLLAVSHTAKQHAFAAVLTAAAVCVCGRWAARTRVGGRLVDAALLRVPLLGDLFVKSAVARFARTFGTLLAAGVPILPALMITRDTSGNVHVAEALAQVHDRVREGATVARPLEATRLFPGMVTSMIDVGEETGALPEMLTRIADTYDEEVDNAVAGLTAIIEPVMIVLMAVVVGVIVVALFLPMVSIIQHLG